jgi:ferritin-like metal-binding protein YciE
MNTTQEEKTLQVLFEAALADIYFAEKEIVKALPKLAEATSSSKLKGALRSHLKVTESQVKRVEKVFAAFGLEPKAKKCDAIVGLIKEGEEIVKEFKNSPASDAAIIAAAQKVEHYEIASYGCLHEWAVLLENQEAADMLEEILQQEKDADDTLTEVARGGANDEAVSDGPDDEDESDEEYEEDEEAEEEGESDDEDDAK